MTLETGRGPIFVGSVALDLIHHGLADHAPPIMLRWGGVMQNAACALAATGGKPTLVTADYEGEFHRAVADHLTGNGVTWKTLELSVPLPVYLARAVGDGRVRDETFIGTQAVDRLAADALDARQELFGNASAIVSCTDLPPEGLAWLGATASRLDVPFWLLCSSALKVSTLTVPRTRPAMIFLNAGELAGWAGHPLRSVDEVAAMAARLTGPAGRCVVTLGEKGACLVEGSGDFIYQPVEPLESAATSVAAGDVMFGCLLGAHLQGLDWAAALAYAGNLTTAFMGRVKQDRNPYERIRRRSLMSS